MRALCLLFVLALVGCGDDFATYEKPAGGNKNEGDYHRCMRQTPVLHRFECRDLK